ncbi:MAG TPA: glycosyltransferase [Candidatus Nanoarchaeia archaeon]|nr:glycosyltransferase [Candidatus Nanoarchaeia archaeon]
MLWIAYITSLYFSIFLLLVYFDKKKKFKTEHSSLHPAAEPLVSVLVPAYNEEMTILKTLASLHELDYPKTKLEVIVIDDGSKDNTKKIVQKYIKDKPCFRLISHPNMGKAASMNQALALVKGEFFACLDADSFVHPLTLKKMLSLYCQKNDPQLAIITPAMKVYQPKNILQKIQWLEYLVIILIARVSSHLDSLYVAPGPFSLYRTEIILRLGGFDEESIVEDQEIAYNVQKNNYRVTQCFDGYVYTVAPRQFKPFYRQRRRWYLGSIICLKKYKQMIANRKYGDFGLMQMTKNVLGYFFAITGITIAIYLLFLPFLEKLKNLLIIKFNILPYLTSLDFKFNLIDLLLADFKKGFIVLFLFVIGAMFFYYAHRNANEKMTKFGWLPLLPYFVFYYLLKGSILLLSLVHFARNKKLKW